MNRHPSSPFVPLLLPLVLALLAACRSTPAASGPPATASGWARAPELGPAAGRRFHVRCEDPVRSAAGARLASAFTEALEAKGYGSTDREEEADLLCRLVIRYLGRSTPPDGQEEVITRAGETILGGEEGWLAADGSGFDTETRTPRGLRSRPRVRGFWGELVLGHEDDQWTLLVDVAIGARSKEEREQVQRHEGRAWATATAVTLERAAATELLLAEIAARLPESLP